jgi:transposase
VKTLARFVNKQAENSGVGSMAHKQGTNRHQSVLFPKVVDDYISDENPVRFIDAYVDSLDIERLGFHHAKTAETGRPPYHPRDLLKLYLYGYLNRIRSSRELEKATQRNVEIMWLLRRLTPDFKTIADFRKDNTEPMKKVCREFTLLCKKLDLFGGELVGIDGSKFSAVNHDSRSYTKQKLQQLIKEIDKKIETYFTRLESEDGTEEHHRAAQQRTLCEHITHLQAHKAELEELQQMLLESGETQVTLTDPDSRLMTTGKHGNDVSYNVQIAVDAKHKLIVVSDLTNEANDLHQLSPVAQAAKEILEVEHLKVTADKGYYNETQIAECEQHDISCYIPEQEKSQNKALGLYTDKDFYFDSTSDTYLCPANQRLSFRFQSIKGNKEVRVYETQCCRQCSLRAQCTRSKRNNRRIYRWVHEDIIEAMRERMNCHPDMARKRKELVEHPFGTIKHWMNHGYFLMREKKKVAVEISMSVLVYNMKRVMNILGVPALLAELRALSANALLSFSHFVYRRFYCTDGALF